MKNNALAHQPDADAFPAPTQQPPADIPAGEPLERTSDDVPATVEPERTVLRELHRMFALIAIR